MGLHRGLGDLQLEDFGMGTSGDINIYRITLRWNGMVTLDTWRTLEWGLTSLGLGDLGTWRTLDTPAEWELGIW